MTKPKKLIEVAMPIKEISAESVRDKSIRHGHISTLHLWWARRPLPVCRAVVFASLVPDPLDEHCPQAFRDSIELLLGKAHNPGDPYHPYPDIPWTSVYDPMEDNLRNRLQMFIGKFTDDMQQHLLHQKPKPAAGNQLSDFSLIKWDNKNNETIIGKARKLIWVAHNAHTGKTATDLITEFDQYYQAIKNAEDNLYGIPDRHLANETVKAAEVALYEAKEAFLDKMPKVFDPFAGGGAIPLEAARLGCKSYGNDINPVAHIIQKGSLEFPQKYGKPITYSKDEFLKIYGQEEWNKLTNESLIYFDGEAVSAYISNRLSFDVEFFAKKLLAETETEIGYLYPSDENGYKPIAYYWARVGICSNPSCKAKIPLLKQFYLVNTPAKQVYLSPVIKEKQIDFEIKTGICEDAGFVHSRKNLRCPVCGNNTSNAELKRQFLEGKVRERLLAVIEESKEGKRYRLPTEKEISTIEEIAFDNSIINEKLAVENTKQFDLCPWGFESFGSMFSQRQATSLISLTKGLQKIGNELHIIEGDYRKSIILYLAIFIDRIAVINTSFGRWNVGGEKIETPFSRQAIAMTFDYPESNMFCNSTGSASNQIDWLLRYINSESQNVFSTICNNASSGDKSQFPDKHLTAVITDPPYYDAIAYADLSDFFYVWLKRTLSSDFPLNFATPQTPKNEECTALKHHRNNDRNQAKKHFEEKLNQIFDAIEHQTSDLVSIMFAHQSTEAWTTLCNSILGARMNITGSWAIDTEMANRTIGLAGAALESSVTVSCRPSQRSGYGEYKSVKKEVEKTVSREVDELYRLGFRGADLLTACFGQAVSEFGKYEKVEKADGSEVTVAELLEMARESAFNALLKGFDGDDFTKFYIGWLQLYSFAESEFDDAAKFSRVGLSINVAELFTEHILIKNGNKQTLGTFEERIKANKNLGDRANNFLIDLVHRAMALYKGNNRTALLQFIGKMAAQPESNFWRVVTSLCEVLPAGSEDHKQALGLLTNKDSLIRESKTVQTATTTQTNLFES
jgi:adenine-specific DNA methylase